MSPAKEPRARKAAASTRSAKKPSVKKPSVRTASSKSKKTATRKPSLRTTSARAASKKKTAAKKATTNKAAARGGARRSPATGGTKKPAATKATPKKLPAKRSAAKKAPAKKSTAKKKAATKSSPKKTAARRAAPARTAPQQPATEPTGRKEFPRRSPVTRTASAGVTRAAQPAARRVRRAKLDGKALAGIKERLVKQREDLSAQITEIDEESFDGTQSDLTGEVSVDEDFADSGTATFDRERALSIQNNIRDLIDQITRAIGRIDEGAYGICERCGRPIDAARLRALPHALLCMDCKRRDERAR